MADFVLIPGAGGSAWFWHRVVAELRRRGHVADAVDLPAADDTAGLAEYADVVVGVIGDRTDVVLVAQSMGGFTAPLVADRVPVRQIVLVNAMCPAPGESGAQWWTNTDLESAHAEAVAREGWPGDMDDAMFHDIPADLLAEMTAAGGPDQSETPFATPWPLPAWPDVPTRFLQGIDDRFFPVEFQRKIVAQRLGVPFDEMPGGHLNALSRPVELADRLEGYLRAPS